MMESDSKPIEPREFKCYIIRAIDDAKKIDVTSMWGGGQKQYAAIKAASLELVTDGPFPYERLHELEGRRVRVTILD